MERLRTANTDIERVGSNWGLSIHHVPIQHKRDGDGF